MKNTSQKLHFLLIAEVLLLNLLIIPVSLDNIKRIYGNYDMSTSYFAIIGIMFLIGIVFRYFKPYIEKYHLNNKIIKFICNVFDISSNPKKIVELKKVDCLYYVFLYAIFILFFYPVIFLINQLIICLIHLYKIIKPKLLNLYAK